jgi:hypothetical protein
MSAPGDYDNGEIGGMIGRENRSTRRKPAPVPLCPPQTPQLQSINFRNISIIVVTRIWAGRSKYLGSISGEGKRIFSTESRPILRPTQPPFK